jgi:SAM-dependent methyltransferase
VPQGNKKPDLHELYETAVQNVDADLDFAERIFRNHRHRSAKTLREDFCGTAKLACEWVKRHSKNQAWGIDIHAPTLAWGEQHHVARLEKKQSKQIHLLRGDVLEVDTPPVDLLFALNFSFCIFKTRKLLLRYFKQAHQNLAPDGLFVMDIYGGTESMMAKSDDTRLVDGFISHTGQKIPDFEYTWEQARFNPINHHTLCHIHFKVPGVGEIPKAFSYDWRLWTLPELQELLLEAGFSNAEVYLHGFNKEGESDEIFRRRKTYENAQAWIAYVVGVR